MVRAKPAQETKGNGSMMPGDRWTGHYRGTKYHFNVEKELWWEFPSSDDPLSNSRVLATGGHEGIVDGLLALKPEGGSCRVTETAKVITKVVADGNPDGEPTYVANLDSPIQFPGVDALGTALRPMDLWGGIPDGAKYSFSGKRVWWKDPADGCRLLVNETPPPDILRVLRVLKPEGGSFRITENGLVFTLILPQPMPPSLRDQFNALTPLQRKLVWVKVTGAKRLPVFVGRYPSGFTLRPRRSLSDPLSEEATAKLVEFLKSFGQTEPATAASSEISTEPSLPDFGDDVEEDTRE
jgi:hypothetical protein